MGGTYTKSNKPAVNAKHLMPFLDVDVHRLDDDRCSFSGVTCLKGGKIVVADYLSHYVKYYDWKMLKLLDAIELLTPPYEVCSSGVCDSEVFVTVPFQYKCMQYKVNENDLKLVREFPTEGRCYGVSCFRDGIALGMKLEKNTWQIEIMDYSGNSLKVFHEDLNGKPFVRYADYIATDREGSLLYVSDGVQNAVLCFNLKDSSMTMIKEIFRYKDHNLSIPKGLTLDTSGNLLVVGCESSNVHKISSTGEKLGVILTRREQLDEPMGISYDPDERKVFVTEGSRKVMVFKDS
ncbi:hypothetical protein DPMN_156335 [Dreissena polymorpha]|uniref:Uncharacterized protein n=1 Tax=Dreissena polymorpha TaxID=45954 RepID=A0A9D4JC93_DREPO|nr:hypothetical protein DPMN_156335 [Dreissena polymorpha]